MVTDDSVMDVPCSMEPHVHFTNSAKAPMNGICSQETSDALMDALNRASFNVRGVGLNNSQTVNDPMETILSQDEIKNVPHKEGILNDESVDFVDYDNILNDDDDNECEYIIKSEILNCDHPMCIYQSKNKRDFDNHCLTHIKNNELPISCMFCFDKFKSISVCNDHTRRKHNKSISRKYLCEICGCYVASYNKSHICKVDQEKSADILNVSAKSVKIKSNKSVNKAVIYHSCDQCNYQSKRHLDLKRHQSVHEKTGLLSCSEKDCTYQCTDKSSFKSHKIKHLKDDFNENVSKVFQCQICLLNFESKDSLALHTKLKHISSCTVCKDCNLLYTNITQHRCPKNKKSNVVVTKICDICGESTANLLKHKYQTHKVSPFSCDICNKQLSTNANLKEHKKNHFKLKSKFVCIICKESFKKSSHLKAHSLIHSEDVDSQMKSCNLCSYETLIDSNLKRHAKIHASKKIKCTLCGKCYRNDTSLRNVNLSVWLVAYVQMLLYIDLYDCVPSSSYLMKMILYIACKEMQLMYKSIFARYEFEGAHVKVILGHMKSVHEGIHSTCD